MKKLPKGKMVRYCLSDIAKGLFNGMIGNYLLYFFQPTAISGIPALLPQNKLLGFITVMAFLTGISKVIDAVTDPWVANISDRCTSKHGRRMPFLKASAIPYAVSVVMIFLYGALQTRFRLECALGRVLPYCLLCRIHIFLYSPQRPHPRSNSRCQRQSRLLRNKHGVLYGFKFIYVHGYPVCKTHQRLRFQRIVGLAYCLYNFRRNRSSLCDFGFNHFQRNGLC